MGVTHDGRTPRLTKDFRQLYHMQAAAADQIREHIARPHRRKLVSVTHQNQPAHGPQRCQQRAHQVQIYHGHLVHNNRIRIQRFFFIFCKRHFAQCLVVAHAQHTVDGLGFTPAGLAQPFGCPPRGRRQLHTQAHTFQQRHDAAHTGGFARSGTARQQKHAGVCRRFYRLALLGSINDPCRAWISSKIASTLRP